MTYLQMWKAFNHVCPLRGVKDWRPYYRDTICVWLSGNRKIKILKVFMIDEYTFRIEPSSEEEYAHFESKHSPTILDKVRKATA